MQSKKDHLEAVKCLLAYDVNVVAKTTDEVNNSSNKKTKTASFKESNQVQKTYCFRRRYFTKLKRPALEAICSKVHCKSRGGRTN